MRGKGEVAPIPAVRETEIERQGSLRVFGHSARHLKSRLLQRQVFPEWWLVRL